MVLKKSSKEVIRRRKSRDRQYNGIKEKHTIEVIRSRKSRDRHYNGIKEKVPKRSSEAVNRGTHNTMVLKKKYQRGN
jgi:hypothetical protein